MNTPQQEHDDLLLRMQGDRLVLDL